MIHLYRGSGSAEIQLVDQESSFEEWAEIRRSASRLLRARGHVSAGQLIEEIPFEIWSGTNFFGDDFSLLYIAVSPEEYVRYEALKADQQAAGAFRQIAESVTEVGRYIRF